MKASQKVEVIIKQEEGSDGKVNWRSEAVENQLELPTTQLLPRQRILLVGHLHRNHKDGIEYVRPSGRSEMRHGSEYCVNGEIQQIRNGIR